MRNSSSVPSHLWILPALALAAFAPPSSGAEGGSTTGSVEPRIVFIDADPKDSAKFEEYRDVPDGLVLDNMDLEWNQTEDIFAGGHFVEFDAKDVSQDDQRFRLRFGSRGLWKATFGYQENQRLWGDGARTLYATDGHGTFTLADSLQAAMQAAPTSADTSPADGEWDAGTKGAILRDAIRDQASAIDLGWERRTGGMAWEFTPTEHWNVGFTGTRERRTGTKVFPVTTNGFSEISELPAPIDYTTDFLTPHVEFRMKDWLVGARYTWSHFENDETTITWDNVVRLGDGPLSSSGTSAPTGRARMSAGTDNQMRQWQLYVAGRLPGHTRINATASHSRTTQDDPFLDPTINSTLLPILEAAPYAAYHLPRSLDGEYTNGMADFRIDSRPLDWLRLKGWWNRYDHENHNPMFELLSLSGDSSIPADPTNPGTTTVPRNAGTLRANLPYGYDKTRYGALAGFRPADFADVQLSWERENVDREHAAVESQEEDTWKLTADFVVTDRFSVRATARTQDRHGDDYDPEFFHESFPNGEATQFAANEGSRKTMWSDRKRDSLGLMAEFMATQKFAIYAQYDLWRSRYYDPDTGHRIGEHETVDRMFPDGVTRPVDILFAGRTRDRIQDYTLGFTISPSADWQISIDHTWEKSEIDMVSRYRNVTGFYDTRPGSPPLPPGGQVSMGWDFPEDDWGSDIDDRARTLSIAWRGTWGDGRWSMRGDFTRVDATGEIENHYAAGQGTIPAGIGGRATPQVIGANGDNALLEFPDLDNDFTVAHFAIERHFASGWDVGFEYWYEQWEYDDWQQDFRQPYVGNPSQDPADATWIQLGADFLDYENHILMVLARYRF